MPSNQPVTAGAGVIIAIRAPEHPFPGLLLYEQRQEFLAIRIAIPAHRAISEGGYRQAAVGADVYAPDGIGNLGLPHRLAQAVETAQIPGRAQEEALAIGGDGQGAGGLVRFEGQALAVELGPRFVLPVADLESRSLDAGRGQGADTQAVACRIVQAAGTQALSQSPLIEGHP